MSQHRAGDSVPVREIGWDQREQNNSEFQFT